MTIRKKNKISLSILLIMCSTFIHADNPFKPKEKIAENNSDTINNQNFNDPYAYQDPYLNEDPYMNNFNREENLEEESPIEVLKTPEDMWEEYKLELTFIGNLNGESIYKDFDYNYIKKSERIKLFQKEYERKKELLNTEENNEENNEENLNGEFQ